MKKRGPENIYNIPNALSLLRIILSPIIIFLVLREANMVLIVVLFAIAALTDGLDGYIARHFNQKTELGRKLDMFADRILMISVVIAILIYYYNSSLLTNTKFIYIAMIMSREIISAPFFLAGLILRKSLFPNARKIAKFTTLMQGITFPMILLGWHIAIYFVALTCICGIRSGLLYGQDLFCLNKFRGKKNK